MEFMTFDAKMGNRAPIKGKKKVKECPACMREQRIERSWEPHLLFGCEGMKDIREHLGFVEYAREKGGDIEEIYKEFWMESMTIQEIEKRVEAAGRLVEEMTKIIREDDWYNA